MSLKKFAARVLLFLSIPLSVPLTASAKTTALAQLRAFIAQTQTAQGTFTQHTYTRHSTSDIASTTIHTGEFVFARPKQFRWAYLKPDEQWIIADGHKLTIYDKDLHQVSIKDFDDALDASPAAVLFDQNLLEKNFDWKETGTQTGVAWLEAIPRNQQAGFARIRIGLRNNQPVTMELHDAFGQITLLNFSNMQRNIKISANTFRFVLPPGTDVLTDTAK